MTPFILALIPAFYIVFTVWRAWPKSVQSVPHPKPVEDPAERGKYLDFYA